MVWMTWRGEWQRRPFLASTEDHHILFLCTVKTLGIGISQCGEQSESCEGLSGIQVFDQQGTQGGDDVCQKTEGQRGGQEVVKDASFEVILDFLNSHPDKGEHHKSNDVRSLFSLVQGSFHHLGYCCATRRGMRLTLGCKSEISWSRGCRTDRVPHCCGANIIRNKWILWEQLSIRERDSTLLQSTPAAVNESGMVSIYLLQITVLW